MMLQTTILSAITIIATILLLQSLIPSTLSFTTRTRVAPSSTPPPSLYPVDTHYFDAVVDHFNFRPTNPNTFPLRYFVGEQYWNGTGPCFFYAGNEADITQFVNHSGAVFEAASEFGALVVFAEHRYYGSSNPFGREYALGRGYNISFLTVEQAMEDFNTLTLHIRDKWHFQQEDAFVAFGGSYGANLAMWLRLKNPNIWAGAIASSATPLKHLLRDSNAFTLIETEVYGNVSSLCPQLVREGWADLTRLASTEIGRMELSLDLSLCAPLPDEAAAEDVHDWISDALETMVQYGYPYPTAYYEPVPAYPAAVACRRMVLDGTGLGALRSAVEVYYNFTGTVGECFDFDTVVMGGSALNGRRMGRHDRLFERDERIERRKTNDVGIKQERKVMQRWNTIEGSNDQSSEERTEKAWGYQTCTEVYQPMPTDGVTDFEIPWTPNPTTYYARCQELWDTQPRPNWEEMTFMGDDIGVGGSNIFLTNGELDPWRAAGIQNVPRGSDGSIIVRTMEGAAHHLDLRAANTLDPPSVVEVRMEQRAAIRRWIKEWAEIH